MIAMNKLSRKLDFIRFHMQEHVQQSKEQVISSENAHKRFTIFIVSVYLQSDPTGPAKNVRISIEVCIMLEL